VSAVPPVLVIAAKELRQRLRDRSAIILALVAPIAIAALMSLAFGSTTAFHTEIGYADLDHGPLAAALTDTLRQPSVHAVMGTRSYATAQQARNAVDSGAVKAAIIVPAGFSVSVNSGAPETIIVVASGDNVLAAQVAQSVTTSFAAQVNADRLSVQTALATGAAPASLPRLAAQAATLTLPETINQQALSDRPLKAISYYAPAMAIFFAMFAIGFGARGYLAEQRDGTLDRIAAAPLRRGTLLAGKLLATFAYAATCMTAMVLVAASAFGADWGNPIGVALLCLGVSVAVVCLTGLVTVLGRTERQAEGLSSIVVFALALLGGNFMFASAMPPLLRRLALGTFNGWALRGFTDLAVGAQGLGAVAAPLLGMALFCLAVLALTVLAAWRRRPV
jgi:linearmycin/streptolysin S transport system permease protein